MSDTKLIFLPFVIFSIAFVFFSIALYTSDQTSPDEAPSLLRQNTYYDCHGFEADVRAYVKECLKPPLDIENNLVCIQYAKQVWCELRSEK